MGYLLHDERASGGRLEEWDTESCLHCQRVIRKGVPEGAHCMKCAGPICLPCAERGGCQPFGRQIDRFIAQVQGRQSREVLRRSIGLKEG